MTVLYSEKVVEPDMMMVAPDEVQLQKLKMCFEKFLYKKDSKINEFLSTIEQRTNFKREPIVYSFLALLGICVAYGSFTQLSCVLIAFAYPAYASVKTIREPTLETLTKWLTYWTVFATFTIFDFFASPLTRVIPLYWALKVTFLLYLSIPHTNAPIPLFHAVVNPAVKSLESFAQKFCTEENDSRRDKQ